MASRIEADPRQWRTIWSAIAKDGTRYRHQVKQVRKDRGGKWWVQTEVWGPKDLMPYYTAPIIIPESHGKHMFAVMRPAWSNVDEEGREMYPPDYPNGFKDLGERDAE